MKKLLTLLIVLLPAAGALAQTDALVRAFIQPEGELYAGQLFSLYIEAKTETYLLTPPDFPHVALENGIAIKPSQLGSSFSERINGTLYSGTRQRFLVSGHQPGVMQIPSYTITFEVAGSGAARTPQTVTLETEPLEVMLVLPPGLDSIKNVAITPNLSIREEISPALEDLQVGDAFTRSITLEAGTSMGFILPAIEFISVSGLKVYSSRPRYDDSNNRGRTVGRRIDSATYLLQQEGLFELPAIEIDWFNLQSGTLEKLEIAAKSFEVAINPIQASVIVASPELTNTKPMLSNIVGAINWVAEHWRLLAAAIGGILLASYFWQRYSALARIVVRERVETGRNSKHWRFFQLLCACLFQSKKLAKKRLFAWMLDEPNSDFFHTTAYSHIQASYSRLYQGEQLPGELHRVEVVLALIGFQFSSTMRVQQENHFNLNP